jgi:hypothetical protein
MSDHTGIDAPIRRPQTCEQKHDATIAELHEQMGDMREALHLLRARVAALEALHTYHIPADASTAPDDPDYVHSPGYPQEDAEPDVVRVPIAGDVDSATGAVSWHKGWHASGWKPVTP